MTKRTVLGLEFLCALLTLALITMWSAPGAAQDAVEIERGLRDRLQAIASTMPGGGTVQIDSVSVEAGGTGATLSGVRLASLNDHGPLMTIAEIRVSDLSPGGDPAQVEIRNGVLTNLVVSDKGNSDEALTVGAMELVNANLDAVVRRVAPSVVAASNPLPALFRAARELEIERLVIRDVALVEKNTQFKLAEVRLEQVSEGQVGRLALSGFQFTERKDNIVIGLVEVVETNYLEIQDKALAIVAETPDEDMAARKILSLVVDSGVLGRASLKGLKFKNNRNAFDLGEFTVQGLKNGVIEHALLAGMLVEEGRECSEVCFNMAELAIGRTNALAIADKHIRDVRDNRLDEEKLAVAIVLGLDLKQLTVKGIAVTSRDADVNLGFFGLENYKAGSPDAVIMNDLAIRVPQLGAFTLREMQSLLSDRYEGKWATRSQTQLNGFEFKADEAVRAQVAPVLGGDTLKLSVETGGKWHEPAGKLEIRPVTVDAPDQAKFDLAMDLGGLPPLAQYMDLVTNDLENENRWMALGMAITLDGLTLGLEERGLVGRLLDLAAKDMGMNDRNQVISMIESEGPRNLGPVIGNDLAADVTAKVAAFLRQGGRISLSIAPKSEPLNAATLNRLEGSPDLFPSLIDLRVTHVP